MDSSTNNIPSPHEQQQQHSRNTSSMDGIKRSTILVLLPKERRPKSIINYSPKERRCKSITPISSSCTIASTTEQEQRIENCFLR